jgi:hypothetical protein
MGIQLGLSLPTKNTDWGVQNSAKKNIWVQESEVARAMLNLHNENMQHLYLLLNIVRMFK